MYAVEQKIQVKDVTTSMLENSTLGIRGYAKLYESTPAAYPQPGGDGSASKQIFPEKPPAAAPAVAKAKAKGKAKAMKPGNGAEVPKGQNPMGVGFSAMQEALAASGDDGANNPDEGAVASTKKPKKGGGNPTGKKEREVKEFLALEAESDNVMSKIAASMAADPPAWTWAKDFAQQYRSLRTEILAMYADIEFFGQMKIAALSAKETSRLKKSTGWIIIQSCASFVCSWASKIRSMSDAQATAISGTPSKASSKGSEKKGPKRSASAASLSV